MSVLQNITIKDIFFLISICLLFILSNHDVNALFDNSFNPNGCGTVYIKGKYPTPNYKTIIPCGTKRIKLDPGFQTGTVSIVNICIESKYLNKCFDATEIKERNFYNSRSKNLRIEDGILFFDYVGTTSQTVLWDGSRIIFADSKQFDESNIVPPHANLKNNIIAGMLFIILIVISGIKNKNDILLYHPFLMIFIIILISPVIMNFIMNSNYFAPPSVRYAVGASSFVGYPQKIRNFSFYVLIAFSVSLSIVWCFIQRRFFSTNHSVSYYEERSKTSEFSTIFLIVCLLVLFIFTFPDFTQQPDKWTHVPQWDVNNFILWTYAYIQGLLPYRDFWYPYFNLFYIIQPFTWSKFLLFVNCYAVLGVLLFSFYIILERNKLITILLMVGIVILSDIGFVVLIRYGAAFMIVMLFMAINRLNNLKYTRFIVFGVVVSWILVISVDQVVYSLPSICYLFIYYLFVKYKKKHDRIFYVKTIFASALTLLLIILLFYIPWYASHDQLEGLLRYITYDIPSMTTYAAVPWDSNDIFTFKLTYDSQFIFTTVFIITFGVYCAFSAKNDLRLKMSEVLISTGILEIMFLLKFFTKVGISTAINEYSFIAALISVSLWSFEWNIRQRIIWHLFILFIISLFINSYSLRNSMDMLVIERINNIFKSVKYIAKNYDLSDKTMASYIASSAFEKYSYKNEFLAFLNNDKPKNFYVLGDSSYFYIIARQKPPYTTTFYDTSPIHLQNKTVEWLKQEKPEYVVINWRELTMTNNVPSQVRVPILYAYVINNYSFYKSFEHLHVLKLKKANYNIDVNYWIHHMTNQIDLGYIPAISNIEAFDDFNDNCSTNNTILFLKIIPKTPANIKRRIGINYTQYKFDIWFKQKINKQQYYINLDRIWFVNAMKGNGYKLMPKIESDSDVDVYIIKKNTRDDLLY